MTSKMLHTCLRVESLEQSIAFYADAFGFKELRRKDFPEHQFTIAYTPQQNGIVERKNSSILNMTRTMLKERGLSKEYWAEAVVCTAYLLNRCPTKSVRNKTPRRHGAAINQVWHA